MYGYEIWYDPSRPRCGKGFDTEEEALEETKLENWESDGAETEGGEDDG